MRRPKSMLTSEQWSRIEPLLPKEDQTPRKGRPSSDTRKVLEDILCIENGPALEMFLDYVKAVALIEDIYTCKQVLWLKIRRKFLPTLMRKQ